MTTKLRQMAYEAFEKSHKKFDCRDVDTFIDAYEAGALRVLGKAREISFLTPSEWETGEEGQHLMVDLEELEEKFK